MTVLFNVKYLQNYNDNLLPAIDYTVEGDACMDLYSVEKAIMNPGDIYVFRTGIKIEVPERHVMLIFSRSGLSTRGLHMANGVGVVDSGFRGEIKVPLKYAPNKREKDDFYIVDIGDRIAQFFIQKVEHMRALTANTLSETARGEGGFGHTGK